MLTLFKKRELHIDFIKQRFIGYMISAVLLIASVVSFCVQGLNYGIDFESKLSDDVTLSDLMDALNRFLENRDKNKKRLKRTPQAFFRLGCFLKNYYLTENVI